MSVVARIRAVLSGETNRAQPSPDEQREESEGDERGEGSQRRGEGERRGENDRSERRDRPETRLYRCDPCGTTYVSDELDSCSQCDAPVEQIPSERDLGLV